MRKRDFEDDCEHLYPHVPFGRARWLKKGSSSSAQSDSQLELMREQLALARQQAAKPPSPNPPMYSAEEEDVNAEALTARRRERKRLSGAVNTRSTLLSGGQEQGKKTLLGE